MKELLQLMRGMACDLLALLLFGWIILRLRTLDSQLRVRIPLHVKAPGVLVMVLGISLMSVCVVAFGLWGRGTPSLLAPTKQMVALGPYRYVRNPIHIGQVIFFLGLGLYLRSAAVLFFSLAWLLFCHLYVVLIEEGSLKKKFGPDYEKYCRTVPRWIPWPRIRQMFRQNRP